MEFSYGGITLRDYRLSDVADEIRWTNQDTTWFYTDTPWMTIEPVDPEALQTEMVEVISEMSEDEIRWRFEIEVDGRHIGMLSSYYLDDNFTQPEWESIDEGKNAVENNMVRALGIEICEMDCWGKGIGPKALTAFMEYYRSLGESRFLLETWSGNARMLGCARKLDFTEVKREKGALTVNGVAHDTLVLEKKF